MSTSHPRLLWALSLNQVFYCLTLGGINALLTLYLITQLHLSTSQSYDIFAAMSSMLFTLPLLGGYLGEKHGYRALILFGFVVALIGILILTRVNLFCMYLGIACFMVGNGFITPNINAMIGLQYGPQSKLRNSGYTIYYLMSNIGFFLSALFSGFLADYSYSLAFLIGAASLLIALLIFMLYTMPLKKIVLDTRILKVIAITLPLIFIVFSLIKNTRFDNILLIALIIMTIIGLLVAAWRTPNHQDSARLLLFLALCILSIGFWSLYMLEPSLLTIFIAESVDRHMLGSNIPAPSYYALDSFFIIVFGLIFSRIWYRLGRSKRDISITSKFSLAIVLMGAAYLIFCLGIINANHTTHLVHSFWIVLAYVFLTIGELLIVPIGLSMVGILFPTGKEGLGMGVWQLFTGLAAVISGYLANLTATPLSHSPVSANAAFFSTFFKIGLSAVVAGLLLMMLFFLINPYLNKLIGNKRGAA